MKKKKHIFCVCGHGKITHSKHDDPFLKMGHCTMIIQKDMDRLLMCPCFKFSKKGGR